MDTPYPPAHFDRCEKHRQRRADAHPSPRQAYACLGDLPDGTYPALFDEETYQQVILRVKSNKAEAIRNSDDPTQFLLRAGFVRCAYCKHLMAGCLIQGSRTSKLRHVYVCPKSHYYTGYRIPSKPLDEEVRGELVQLTDHITLIEEAVKLATNQDNSAVNLKAGARPAEGARSLR